MAALRDWARSGYSPRVVDSLTKAMPQSGGGGFGASSSRVTEPPKVRFAHRYLFCLESPKNLSLSFSLSLSVSGAQMSLSLSLTH